MCVKLILWFFQIACYGHIELFWEILLEWRGWEPSKGEAGWGGGGGRVPQYMDYIGMCHCERYGFQAM